MTKNKNYEETPNANNEYISERDLRVEQFSSDKEFINLSKKWRENALKRKYMNNFSWMGRPLIQFPGDVMAVQELISTIKPNKVIETGIAHGGSLILSSSMMFLNNIKNAEVIGIDIEIREHNKVEINKSRFSDMISLMVSNLINPLSSIKYLPSSVSLKVVIFPTHPTPKRFGGPSKFSDVLGCIIPISLSSFILSFIISI